MGVGGQCHAPVNLPPGRTRYPRYRKLDRSQGRSGRVWQISPPLGFDPWTLQPVVSSYIDCTYKKKSTEALVVASKDTGLEVNDDKILSTWSCLKIRMQDEVTRVQILRNNLNKSKFYSGRN